MTKHEAIEVLEEVKILDDSMFAYSQVYNDALSMAIEALKAQEAVKPQEKREGDYRNLYCGACGRGIVGYVGHLTGKYLKLSDYCDKCGSAVKWE